MNGLNLKKRIPSPSPAEKSYFSLLVLLRLLGHLAFLGLLSLSSLSDLLGF